MITLYPYQQNVLDAITSDPSPSQLISMPTGTGKTITFLSVVKKAGKKCLILVHREELLKQTYDKAIKLGFIEREISLITSQDKPKANVLNIAMVPTLVRNLDKYQPDDIEMMVIDEAHHATAPSYTRIIDHFKIKSSNKLLLGFTATPLRGDKDCLSSVFESHTFKMTLSEATQLGYIVPAHGIRISMDKGLADVENIGQDYDLSKLDKIMNCPEVNDLICDRCKHMNKVPGIIFCTSVDHARNISKGLRKCGRKAISVSYKTSKPMLKRIFDLLNRGRIEFITNAVKLSEGFDHPPIQTVIIARPTRSPVLYKQMIGRGLRNSPDKEECFVLEFSDSDPKMIKWEDIDENNSFQSFNEKSRVGRKAALDNYKTIFRNSPNVKILNVRESHFNFYECFIRRIVKFRKFYYYAPTQDGFAVFELIPSKSQCVGMDRQYNFKTSFLSWKEKYRSFTFAGGWKNEILYESHMGYPIWSLVEKMDWMLDKQNLAIWYPSELEPVRNSQKKIANQLMIKGEMGSARRAQMLIEDTFIKRAIEQFWMKDKFPEVMTIH